MLLERSLLSSVVLPEPNMPVMRILDTSQALRHLSSSVRLLSEGPVGAEKDGYRRERSLGRGSSGSSPNRWQHRRWIATSPRPLHYAPRRPLSAAASRLRTKDTGRARQQASGSSSTAAFEDGHASHKVADEVERLDEQQPVPLAYG